MQQFDQFRASELLCPRCRVSRPMRERLLLVVPGAEIYEYRCQACGASCGTREVKAGPMSVDGARAALAAQAAKLRQAAARRPARGALPPRR